MREKVDVCLIWAGEVHCHHIGSLGCGVKSQREDRMVPKVLPDWEVEPFGFIRERDSGAAILDDVYLVGGPDTTVVQDSRRGHSSCCKNDFAAILDVDNLS